jgi:hypothetical protein
MNISKLAGNSRLCKALTGLSYQEFSDLVPVFEKALYELRMQKPKRKRKAGAGQKGKLPTVEAKLLFILFYLKTYPTYDVLAFVTDRDRGRCCKSVHFFSQALRKALGKKLVLPQRKISSVEEFMTLFPEAKDIFLDGTERRVARPKDAKRQRKSYSGKKKANTRKNIVMTDERKRILLLSPTKSGRRHDKRLADKIALVEHIPKHVGIFVDSGFQGIQHAHPNVCLPKRGSKKHPLEPEEKKNNHIISSIRVSVEHAIGGVKRFRSLSDVFRNRIGILDDLLMEIGAGLWNYHLGYVN